MFWFTLVEPETLLMIYVQSIRESNFKLFVSHLHNIIPWMFALDQIHYTRWLTVHIEKILSLEVKNRNIWKFYQLIFSDWQIKKNFSKLAIDQIHEKNDKLVKVDRDIIGIFENEATLLTWDVARPITIYIMKTADLF